MDGIPRFPDFHHVPCVRPHDVPEIARGRLVHVGAAVQFYPANVFVSRPNMNVRRLEGVLSGVDHEAKLTLN